MFEKLKQIEAQFEELSARMADPEVASDPRKYREAATAYADLEPLVRAFRDHGRALAERDQARALVDSEEDGELRAMAREEVARLDGLVADLETRLKVLLLPRDPNDAKDVILEVRAGTGGSEATLFAAELFRMYQRYCERRGWSFEALDVHRSEVGGVKEAVAQVSGEAVYSRLKFESGVHRVQRVPETEASGRIHTSAASVAVLPEAEDVEVAIDEGKDIRVDTFCSSGPGGQSVNTTYSAVRITHLPTGLVVQCQDEKSWHKNRAKAMKVLRSRLLERMRQEQHEAIAAERRDMIKTGDRSEKVRTYNFPQNRVSDHRIGLTLHRLDQIVEGDLDELLDALQTDDQARRLQEVVA